MVDAICKRLAIGEGLITICKDPAMPGQETVYRWLRDDESFREKYTQAREDQAENDADRQVKLAESATVNNWKPRRLLLDALRWRASKMWPKKYGERLDVNATMTARVVFDCDYGQPNAPLPLLATAAPAALPRRAVEVEDARIVETVPAAAETAEASPSKGRYRGQLL